jgi:hypothetical protein
MTSRWFFRQGPSVEPRGRQLGTPFTLNESYGLSRWHKPTVPAKVRFARKRTFAAPLIAELLFSRISTSVPGTGCVDSVRILLTYRRLGDEAAVNFDTHLFFFAFCP